MSIEEVRSAFLGLYEKRLRLQLLAAELASLQQSALDAIVPESDRDTKYSLVTFSIQTIESLIADTYPLTARVAPLLPSLQQLRQAVIVANNKTRIFYSTAGLSFSNAELRNREHNNFMDGACRQIVAHATQALALLNELLAD